MEIIMNISTQRFLKISLTITICCLFAACAGFGSPDGRPLSELSSSLSNEQSYKISAGDTLNIDVWGETRLSGEQFVRQDGHVSMPLAGEVKVEGLNTAEAAADITEKLAVFIPTASVNVSVARTAAIRFYLTGTFAKPGEYRSDSKITLLQAIATGGGFAPFANESNVILIRSEGGQERRYKLDYGKVIAGQEPNPELKNGDVISVR
jgi:polysaccharide export outer membrane protein